LLYGGLSLEIVETDKLGGLRLTVVVVAIGEKKVIEISGLNK
jgi:hypothetical protein